MRILALSDIHGKYEKAQEILARERTCDVILLSGDITAHGSPAEAEEALNQFQSYGIPVMAVSGNMDSPEIDNVFALKGSSLNAQGIIIGDIGFFGVSAAPLSPLHTPYEISEDEILRRAEAGMNNVKDARWKVFVPHAPPSETKLDRIFPECHVGSTAVRIFIERRRPEVVVCGHIHESRGTDTLGGSRMINCGTTTQGYYAVVEIGKMLTVENCG